MPGKALWEDTLTTVAGRTGFCESRDDGLTWQWIADLPVRDGDDRTQYHELHAIETTDRRIIAHIRNHNTAQDGEDTSIRIGGRRQNLEHAASHRRVGAAVPSHAAHGRDIADDLWPPPSAVWQPGTHQYRSRATWSDPLTISADGGGGDLGYPSTVELADKSLVTVWYEAIAGSPRLSCDKPPGPLMWPDKTTQVPHEKGRCARLGEIARSD